TLQIRNNLASAYLAAGRTADAIALHDAMLKSMESRLSPDHPHVLQIRNNLAAAYWRAGRLDRSVPLFEETLRLQTSNPGPAHPDTLLTLANLGVNCRDAGRRAEGTSRMAEALRRARGHPDALARLAWVPRELAATYDTNGQHAEAEPLLIDGLEQ